MSAHVLPLALDRALRAGFFNIPDPKSAGTLSWSNKERVVCVVDTLGAETRNLPSATPYADGTTVLVIFRTDGGDLTIDYGTPTTTLTAAGQAAMFVAVSSSTTTKVWTLVFTSSLSENLTALFGLVQGANLVSIPLANFRVFDAMESNLPSEATSEDSDDFGMRTATVGTTAGALVIKVSNATTAPKAVVLATVPPNYQDGQAISIVIPWVREDAATTSATLDLVAYRNAAPTVDICATAAQNINAAASGTATFVLTPTNVVAGETILLELIGAVVDGTTALFSFPSVGWSYSV